MPSTNIRKQVAAAVTAVENKKAEDVALLQLPHESSTFTDYFLICSGSNPRQVQAIADEVDERLSKDLGVEPNAREGYNLGEWILLDYVDFVVHIFNAQRRAYYDLERLWKSAHRLTLDELLKGTKPEEVGVPAPAAIKAVKKAVKKTVKKAVKKVAKKAAKKAVKKAARKPAAKKSAKKTTKKAAKKSAKR